MASWGEGVPNIRPHIGRCSRMTSLPTNMSVGFRSPTYHYALTVRFLHIYELAENIIGIYHDTSLLALVLNTSLFSLKYILLIFECRILQYIFYIFILHI